MYLPFSALPQAVPHSITFGLVSSFPSFLCSLGEPQGVFSNSLRSFFHWAPCVFLSELLLTSIYSCPVLQTSCTDLTDSLCACSGCKLGLIVGSRGAAEPVSKCFQTVLIPTFTVIYPFLDHLLQSSRCLSHTRFMFLFVFPSPNMFSCVQQWLPHVLMLPWPRGHNLKNSLFPARFASNSYLNHPTMQERISHYQLRIHHVLKFYTPSSSCPIVLVVMQLSFSCSLTASCCLWIKTALAAEVTRVSSRENAWLLPFLYPRSGKEKRLHRE